MGARNRLRGKSIAPSAITIALLTLALSARIFAATPLAELQRQLVNARYLAYFHYGMNSFSGEGDWGSGTKSPTVWRPTGLNCAQWADALIAGKMAGGILTTKHHDGFCLWDSKAKDPTNPTVETTYDVGSSTVKTDVVKAFTDAFRAKGLKVGLYYSLGWDRHFNISLRNVNAAKLNFVKQQVVELLSNYGKIDYINFDGWDSRETAGGFCNYNDIPYHEIFWLVKSIQPDCIILSHTYETNLAHTDVPFADCSAWAGGFEFNKAYTYPIAGSDCIQNIWFWNTSIAVNQSVTYLINKLKVNNSRNGVYVLNCAPNRAGQLDNDVVNRLRETAAAWTKPADVAAPLTGWGYQYDVTTNLAFQRPCTQSSIYQSINPKPLPEYAVDGVTEGKTPLYQTCHTNSDARAWWQVDLQGSYSIGQIKIYNRTDANPERLNDYTVSILDSNKASVWSNRQTTIPSPSTTITVPNTKGRFVKVQLTGTNYLALAEVIVSPAATGVRSGNTLPGKNFAVNYRAGRLTVSHDGEYMVELTNALGRQVRSFTGKGRSVFAMDASSIARGIYFATVQAKGAMVTERICVE